MRANVILARKTTDLNSKRGEGESFRNREM